MMSLFLYRFPFTLLFLFRCRFRFRFRFLFPSPFLFRIRVAAFPDALYFAHVDKVRKGYYHTLIKEYIFNRPPDYKIRLLSTYCSYFVKGLNPRVIS